MNPFKIADFSEFWRGSKSKFQTERSTMIQKKEFAFSAFFSLLFHAIALLLLQTYSFWNETTHKETKAGNVLPKGQVLKLAFRAPPQKKVLPPHPALKESTELKSDLAFLEKADRESSTEPLFDNHLDLSHLYAVNDAISLQPFPPTLELFSETPSFTLFPAPLVVKPTLSPPKQHLEQIALNEPVLPNAEPVPAQIFGSLRGEGDISDVTVSQRALLGIPTPPLPAFPTLEELETSSYSEDFDLEISCEPKDDGSGYLFALTLIPHADVSLSRIRQHYTFLIDRSNSIQRERLLATKSAVLKALRELSPEDTFNIFVFDSKVEKLFPRPQPPNMVSLSQARNFLDPIQLGSFFTPANLYAPLLMTLPGQSDLDEVHTAILITDGENFAKKSAIQTLLNEWTWQNNGNVSLFTIGMSADRHLSALEAISVFNRGQLFYSPTKRGIQRKLLKLMKNVRGPLAKNVLCKVIDAPAEVQIFPQASRSPHLYADQPFVILGSCPDLNDFILFVQGRLKGRWMNIKKTISFISAKEGGKALKREWALQQAFQCYERYVHDDNPDHLSEAANWLLPYNIQPALQ